MMNYQILDLSKKNEWQKYFDRMPTDMQDIYYSPNYYQVSEDNDFGKALCFIYEDGNNLILYPFLKNKINNLGFTLKENYYDIQGAYGYNGIISNTENVEFIQSFNKQFAEYCRKENIIAEFMRFNPILQNHKCPGNMSVVADGVNVISDLTTEDIIKNSYSYSTRKNLKKAIRSGLSVVSFIGNELTDNWLDLFIDIYYSTMDRNIADNFYYFSKRFFNDIIRNNSQNYLLVFTMFESKAISAELVLFGREIGYSYLGGTKVDYFHLHPNDILKDHIIFRLKDMGLKYFCIGGGSEGIINYKKRFAKDGLFDFFIGKNIYNEKIYNHICAEWEKKNPEKIDKYKHFLLKYRY